MSQKHWVTETTQGAKGVGEQNISKIRLTTETGKPRVIHLSTGHAGGAGLAARRLNAGLNAFGFDSLFVAIQRKEYLPQDHELALRRSLIRKLGSTILLSLQSRVSKKILFSTLSANAASYSFFSGLAHEKNTILHFHNWANLVSEKNLLKLIDSGANIVITAHDQRISTGGCHYSFECPQIHEQCSSCPLSSSKIATYFIHKSKISNSKKMIHMNNLPIVIAPSKWISEELVKSGTIKSESVHVISNTLGPNWNPANYSYRRNPRVQKVTVGVASMSVDSYVKAGDIISQLKNSQELKNLGFSFIFLNEFEESTQQVSFWEKIDVLLALSRADNSPNVIWEAGSMGIPVVSVDVGGIPEIIRNGSVLLLENPEISVPTFLNPGPGGVLEFLDRCAREQTQVVSNLNSISERNHIALYNKILKSALAGESR